MKLSQMHFRTLREVPTEAEIPSHILLLRAGMIKKVAAGIYSYMPMGWRTIRKIEQTKGLDFLPEKLKQTALLRLANPDISITALGELCDPPLKKSGINKRLMRLEEIAAKL